MKFLFLALLTISLWLNATCDDVDEDFYSLLGVTKSATIKEIRKAFKALALRLHPDKNKDDKDSEKKFIKITYAYEILKDPESRKQYDLVGDTGSTDKTQNYHSYTYYKDQFGIYDDDPLVITLSRQDYDVNILDSNKAWFVNFYSPHCHHCHTLAPTWRRLAVEFEGVVTVAAVNCEDDWSLCYQLGVTSYPTLLFYDKDANIHEGLKYRSSRTFIDLHDFIISKLHVTLTEVNHDNWENDTFKKSTWLLFLCDDGSAGCPQPEEKLKLAASLDGLIRIGIVTDTRLRQALSEAPVPMLLWQVHEHTRISAHPVEGAATHKEIIEKVLTFLPDPEPLDRTRFWAIRAQLTEPGAHPWLVCFYLGPATELSLTLKRLPATVPGIKLGLVHCGRSAELCTELNVNRYPMWAVLKVGGAFELHHGRDTLQEVAAFAQDGTRSTNLYALSEADFRAILDADDGTWFIDWFAPWCPPCRKFLPELRRASQHFDANLVKFGTIDCTQHRDLCRQQGIASYPTAMLYNGTKMHRFHGMPSEEGIVDFVNDMRNPNVITLDEDTFSMVKHKPRNQLWVVNYFAPWCGACVKMAPEWRKLAKEMLEFPEVKVAQVDCQTYGNLCHGQNIENYPTIRLYHMGSEGLYASSNYMGGIDLRSLKWWIFNYLPSSIKTLSSAEFEANILNAKYVKPWLVEFYAPWCSHCVHFEPEYRKVAHQLEGTVNSVKVDCEIERIFCGQIHINKYPTLILYVSSTEKYEIMETGTWSIVKNVQRIIDNRSTSHHDEL